MIYPALDVVTAYAADYNVIPIALEIHADMETPISLFHRFREGCDSCFLFESVEGGEKWARYSFMGRRPFMTLVGKDGRTTITQIHGCIMHGCSKTYIHAGNPLDALRDIMSYFKAAPVPGLPRFCGGAAGYFGYDMVRYCEYLPDTPVDDLGLPDCNLMLVDELLVFDRLKQKIIIIVNILTDECRNGVNGANERNDGGYPGYSNGGGHPGYLNDGGHPGIHDGK